MTNARWQRWMVWSSLLLTVAWVAWQWSISPVAALAGPALAWLAMRLLMALQFVAMAWANREEPMPRPGVGRMVRAWWTEAGWASVIFGWWQPFRRGAIPDWLPGCAAGGEDAELEATAPAPRGVVLVHGFLCNRGFWTPWLPLLRARGHAFVAVDLEPPFGSIDGYAAQIDAAVRRVTEATGRAPVVIGHSMGGVAARAWLRACDAGRAEACAHRIITLGAPHAGTWPARFSHAVNGREMALEGPWVQALRQAEPAGRARRKDDVVAVGIEAGETGRAATLPGADNRLVEGVAHVQLAFHPPVVQACLDLLRD